MSTRRRLHPGWVGAAAVTVAFAAFEVAKNRG